MAGRCGRLTALAVNVPPSALIECADFLEVLVDTWEAGNTKSVEALRAMFRFAVVCYPRFGFAVYLSLVL